ncbi:MAG: histidine phosphatase family protein [Acidimicrobiales bacterium]
MNGAGPVNGAGGERAPAAGVRTVPAAEEGATRVVLVRHGESVCNIAGVVGGHAGCTGLSPAGVSQVEALRSRLAVTGELASAVALYSSVIPRAVQTASIIRPVIGGGRLEVVQDCGLCELHPGEADGLSWGELAERFGEPDWDEDPTSVLAPGGESWSGFVDRASAAVEEVALRHQGGTVVIACHAGVVEATVLAFLPIGAGRHRLGLRTSYASLTEWELRDRDSTSSDARRRWRLCRFNDGRHLLAG